MIRFRCPKCEGRMEVDEAFANRAMRCPTCGQDLKVPKKGEATPALNFWSISMATDSPRDSARTISRAPPAPFGASEVTP